MAKIQKNKQKEMQEILDSGDIGKILSIVEQLDEQTRVAVLAAISKQIDINSKNVALGTIKTIIKGSDTQIKDWVAVSILNSYVTGANIAYKDLNKLDAVSSNPKTFMGKLTPEKIKTVDSLVVHKDAVNALISDTYLDFANGMNGLVKGAEHQLNDALKRQTRARMISGQITGDSIRVIAKDVKEIIGKQGFSVLIDKGGRQWTLKQYSNMLARTHIIKSANEGSLNRMIEFNVDIVEISTHAGTEDSLCLEHEGKIYSIGGKSKRYPQLASYPPYHPNCKHTYLPRPDLDESV